MKITLSSTLQKIFDSSRESQNNNLETESFYDVLDAISEGPIEGLVNSDGQAVNYINTNASNVQALGYGVYYNDVPIRDKNTDLYNFSGSKISFTTGDQTKNSVSPSTAIYAYKSKVSDVSLGAILLAKKNNFYLPPIISKGSPNITSTFFTDKQANSDQKVFIAYRNYSRAFSHYIKNKYTTSLNLNIGVETLYDVHDNGSILSNDLRFIINVSNLTQKENFYLYVQGSFVAKGGTVVLPFEIIIEDIDKKTNLFPEIVVSVYSLSEKIIYSTNQNRSFHVESIVEKIDYPFSYPYSALCRNTVSSRHFNNVPTRSYDCKLLKIKVPDNYDGEAREYDEYWSGNFSRTLKWTNNPAWIFYDLCINSRYGMAKGKLNETDLNKFQLLSISKYCDELVKTNVRTKYDADFFYFENSLTYGDVKFNTITFSTGLTEAQIQEKYPIGYTLYLYDLKNTSGEYINQNFKKVILTARVSSNIATLFLCNDFGPRKILESDVSGVLFSTLQKIVTATPSLNIENIIKNIIASFFVNATPGINSSGSEALQVSVNHTSKPIFEKFLNVRSGYCVAKHSDDQDFLEPRFSCNLILNSENEGLKALTDLASIFRGMFYFKNGMLNLTSDIKQNSVYVFTNSNVKDGLFTYSSGDLNNLFTVAKVKYSDKNDNFKDKIIYVEDSQLIRQIGIVEKELLGFGVTSKYEAQRIGKWYLATSKLESEIVNFISGFEASILQIGNVVRISDSLKTSSIIYGKLTKLDFVNKSIHIDREVSEDCLGELIRIFSLINDNPVELIFSIIGVDNKNLKLSIIPSAYMSWNNVSNIVVADNGSTLTPSASSSSTGWDKKAYTNKSYVGACQIVYTSPNAASDQNVVGLSTVENISEDQQDIDYGFLIVGGGLSVIMDGTTYSIAVEYNTVKSTDILKITYDGKYINFLKNNIAVYSPVSPGSNVKGKPLYGVVALFNRTVSKISDLSFSKFPDYEYGKYAALRSDANFVVYLEEDYSDNDLYRIVNINEVSSNEYAVTAMKYDEEKFNIVENNEYINNQQNKQKQIVFSTDNFINQLFTNDEINLATNNGTGQTRAISFAQSVNTQYDYSFTIEKEVLNDQFNNSIYDEVDINFKFLFDILSNRENYNTFGLMCVINRNGKAMKFNILKENAFIVKIFLGETSIGSFVAKTDIDFYAFDSNYKIINV